MPSNVIREKERQTGSEEMAFLITVTTGAKAPMVDGGMVHWKMKSSAFEEQKLSRIIGPDEAFPC